MVDFYCSNEFPPLFKWVHLKIDEREIVAKLFEKTSDLQDLILAYEEEKAELLSRNMGQADAAVLIQKHLPPIALARAEIICTNLELKSLGNKMLKSI